MKVVILAGGLGVRLREETISKPKPMVEIGGRPILWHIMKIYLSHGIKEFIICLGYRGYVIKEYFSNYALHMSTVTFDMEKNTMHVHENMSEPWKITLVDTGEHTQTGGRLKRVRDYLGDDDFCMTYGDGVGDIDVASTIDFHKAHGALVTLTATRPPGRFGALETDGDKVVRFQEKPTGDGSWINGGFFVINPAALDYVEGDEVPWELAPLQRIAAEGQLRARKHYGFWQPMDTLRDMTYLEELWASGSAPWKIW
ncbi:MAG: glucose-1-phosphate cytidylyltransferase [Niveispirillum sp.]|nr:glucose-1-phosphate cytidylyltransferase [Niveispirillum sp.]